MRSSFRFLTAASFAAITLASSSMAMAGDPAACKTVRFSDVGWTDNAVTNGIATTILKGLGYESKVQVLALPVTYESLKNKDIDVFLDNWMMSQEANIKPYLDNKTVEVPGTNMTGAKYTLAVPTYLYEKGLKSFADIAKFKDELKGKIYGIEPGNDGNRLVQGLIDKDQFGLKGFSLVESSEQGMLAEVDRATRKKEAVVFLGWAPHPMNVKYKMSYLAGGDDTFGPDYGAARVDTNVRAGYLKDCPNAGKFISNLKFTVDAESVMMGYVLDDGVDGAAAGAKWLKANPDALKVYLDGVTTFDGQPGLDAVKKSLGL